MGDDVRTPLKRAAVYRSCKCVVYDERYAVAMCYAGKLLYVEHIAARVCYGLAKQCLGIRTESLLYLLLTCLGIDKGAFDAQFLKSDTEEVECSAVDFIGSDYVTACLTDVENSIEVCCLSAACEHSTDTTLESSYLARHRIIGWVLQTGIEITLFLKVEEHRHLFAVVIFECCALHYRQHSRFAILRLPPCLYAERGLF